MKIVVLFLLDLSIMLFLCQTYQLLCCFLLDLSIAVLFLFQTYQLCFLCQTYQFLCCFSVRSINCCVVSLLDLSIYPNVTYIFLIPTVCSASFQRLSIVLACSIDFTFHLFTFIFRELSYTSQRFCRRCFTTNMIFYAVQNTRVSETGSVAFVHYKANPLSQSSDSDQLFFSGPTKKGTLYPLTDKVSQICIKHPRR